MVDDEPALLQLLKMNLEEEGFETALAADGATALQRIKELKPDLVILDVMMPSLDGWEVLTQLQQLDLGTKVLLLTAKGGSQDRERAMELGADVFMTKPFEIDELMTTIRELIPSRKRR